MKNVSDFPFLRRGQRSVWSSVPSPSEPSLGCWYLSQYLRETPDGWVPLIMGHAADGNIILSQFLAEGDPYLGEDTAEMQDSGEDAQKNCVSSNILHSQRLLFPCTKCLCAFSSWSDARKRKVLQSVLNSHFYYIDKHGEFWANKVKDFLCELCLKKAIFLYLWITEQSFVRVCIWPRKKEGPCLEKTLC